MFRLNVSILSQVPIITHLGLKATAKDNLMKQRDQNHFFINICFNLFPSNKLLHQDTVIQIIMVH